MLLRGKRSAKSVRGVKRTERDEKMERNGGAGLKKPTHPFCEGTISPPPIRLVTPSSDASPDSGRASTSTGVSVPA